MIDLHLHTTASDGMLAPAALVSRAAAAGLRVISVTDHDTTAGIRDAAAAAVHAGLTLVPGIEITAVEGARDVHILGYFIDAENRSLLAFLERQRADRVRRVTVMASRLRELGLPVDEEALLARASERSGRSVGRPQIADALVASGHVSDRDEAFERWLGDGCPAFVPRCGEPPEGVIDIIRRAGGIASLAHPALQQMDDVIPRLAHGGLAALEVRHSDHDAAAEERYRAVAARLGLAVSGGSDYHGDTGHRACPLGSVTLSQADFDTLQARVA